MSLSNNYLRVKIITVFTLVVLQYLFIYVIIQNSNSFVISAFNHMTQVRPAFLRAKLTYLIVTAEFGQDVVGVQEITHG